MSGPVQTEDVQAADQAGSPAPEPIVEVIASRQATVGRHTVARALPTRGHRTVGAWCFADHMLPSDVPMAIGPHPHIGLQTVTWLVEGELLHTDSLGSEQLIRPGQLNLMTAGRGVAHAEESPAGGSGRSHGVQLWVAQPEGTRAGPPAFEHHAELPRVELDGAVATVLVGTVAGTTSPARRDSDHLGAELVLPVGTTVVPVRPDHEHALVVVDGAVTVDGHRVGPGALAYLGLHRDELALTAGEPARLLLLGGEPFPEPLVMWWNFVARTRDEVDDARADWEAGSDRFGTVPSALDRIPAPPVPWRRDG